MNVSALAMLPTEEEKFVENENKILCFEPEQ